MISFEKRKLTKETNNTSFCETLVTNSYWKVDNCASRYYREVIWDLLWRIGGSIQGTAGTKRGKLLINQFISHVHESQNDFLAFVSYAQGLLIGLVQSMVSKS